MPRYKRNDELARIADELRRMNDRLDLIERNREMSVPVPGVPTHPVYPQYPYWQDVNWTPPLTPTWIVRWPTITTGGPTALTAQHVAMTDAAADDIMRTLTTSTN